MSNRTVRFIIAKLNNFSEIILVIREDIQLSVITALKKRQRRRRRRPTADVVQSVAALKTTKQDNFVFVFGNRVGGGQKSPQIEIR